MNDEVAQFDIDTELSALWQKAYCAVRDIVSKKINVEIVLNGSQVSVLVDECGQVLFRINTGTYDLAENFDDATMYNVLRCVTAI